MIDRRRRSLTHEAVAVHDHPLELPPVGIARGAASSQTLRSYRPLRTVGTRVRARRRPPRRRCFLRSDAPRPQPLPLPLPLPPVIIAVRGPERPDSKMTRSWRLPTHHSCTAPAAGSRQLSPRRTDAAGRQARIARTCDCSAGTTTSILLNIEANRCDSQGPPSRAARPKLIRRAPRRTECLHDPASGPLPPDAKPLENAESP